MQADAALTYRAGFLDGLKPDPILTVSEWADEFRILSSKSAAEPGRWRTSRTPYLKEIMDTLSPGSGVQEVWFIKGAQVGGTECGNNWIGFIIDHAPGPMMAVQPTVDMAKRNSKQRIAPLIEECPRIRAKVSEAKSKDSENTILEKDFPGGRLVMTGANSAVGLRSMPARYLFLDEVDGYPGDVDGEGDPVQLARARARTFPRRKLLAVSTPTIAGRSRIEAGYEASDRRRFWVPCPLCSEFQTLKWAQVKIPKDNPEAATYRCEHCEREIQEHQKTGMLERGQWRAENPGVQNGKVAGFHINSLYSPVGWFSWGEAAKQWLEAQGKPELLKGFINTVLGETWKDKGDAPEWERIFERREVYPMNVIPMPGVFLTAGVDVQKDRLEVEIVAWGRDRQSWSVDYRVILGDTADTTATGPWTELDRLLMETFPHANGSSMPIRMLAVDSGFNTQIVYNWARRHPLTRVMACKGVDTAAMIIGQPSTVDVTVRGRRVKRGFRIWTIGVSVAKSELYAWLRLRQDPETGIHPPGFCHFPQYGPDYFKMLTAEQLVVHNVRGFKKYIWEKVSDRNEALDCRVYARAAAAVVGMDRFSPQQWERFMLEVGNAPVPVAPQVASGSAASPAPPPKVDRKKRSSFWDR